MLAVLASMRCFEKVGFGPDLCVATARLSPFVDTVAVGSTIAFEVPGAAKQSTFRWLSHATDVATVDRSGRVTAVSVGGAEIVARDGQCTPAWYGFLIVQ